MKSGSRILRLLHMAVICPVVVITGCGGPSEPAPAASVFPPRPTDLDITKISPCAAVTDVQRRRLDVGSGTPGEVVVSGVSSAACGWQNLSNGFGYNVQTIPLPADQALGEPGSKLTTVNGFGAVQNSPAEITSPGIPAFCQLIVDVNEGQNIRIQVQSSDVEASTEQSARDDVCARVNTFASEVMKNLAAEKGS